MLSALVLSVFAMYRSGRLQSSPSGSEHTVWATPTEAPQVEPAVADDTRAVRPDGVNPSVAFPTTVDPPENGVTSNDTPDAVLTEKLLFATWLEIEGDVAARPPAEIAEGEPSPEIAGDVLEGRPVSAMWLYYVENLSVNEIALALGCTRAAVEEMLLQSEATLFPLLADL
jgi:hypothetical protein